MHDALGHRLSLLSVHAGALTYYRDASADEIGRAAEVVRENARRALQDLREVIGVLRAPDGDHPLPGVADVVELVDETGRSGTPVDLKDVPGVTAGGRAVPEVTRRLIDRVAGAGQDTRRDAARRKLDSLADRERTVAVEIGAGRSNAEIAALHHIGLATVKTHVSAILTKLDLTNRVQVAVLVHDAGLGPHAR